MKKYSILHAPLMSFFSRDLYRDVALHWRGIGFGYLFIILLLCWIPVIIRLSLAIEQFVEEEAPPLIAQIPSVTISNGYLSVDVDQPYEIKDRESGNRIVIIDTTGQVVSLDDTEAIGLVTATEVIYKANKYKTETFELKDVDNLAFDAGRVAGWLQDVASTAPPFLYAFAVIGSFLSRLLQLIVYALIGALFASLCKTELTYKSLLRLSAIAVTPVIVLKTILLVAGVTVPHAGPLWFLVAMGYLFFGVKAAATPQGSNNMEGGVRA